MEKINFKIVEKLGVLSENNSGWTKEINLVSWNGGPARYDIRDWDPMHERMSKGITLTEEQMDKLIVSVEATKAFR